MIPIKGQNFKTDKGHFEVVGNWFNKGELKSIEIKETSTGIVTEIEIEIFMKHENKINYAN